MKRGTNHSWEIRKYNGDIAWYAHCKCGYQYACSKNSQDENGTWLLKQQLNWLAFYCPNCGARKKWYNEEPIKINKFIWE